MKRVIIFSGGSIDLEFVKGYLSLEDEVICADRGLMAAHKLGIVPKLLVGDFDSLDASLLAEYEKRDDVKIVRFRPEKDDTDTELALHMALEKKPDEILIFGAFGTRMDHATANIGLLSQTLEQGVTTYLCDPHNKISMIKGSCHIKKEEAFGNYITLLPFGGDAKGVTLRGFKYLLNDALMKSGTSLGVSNELVEAEGVIEVREGKLLVMESRD